MKKGVFIFMIIILFLLFIIGCQKQQNFSTITNETIFEITETDIIALPNITSLNVAVFGVRLGDRYEKVIEKLGEPDYVVKDYICRGILNL